MHAHIDSFCGVQDRSLRVSGRAELGRAELGGYFACSEVTGSAERDLRGCVWPLSCPGQPAGRQRRVAGRRGTEATRSPRVASSAAMRGGTSGDRPPGLRREDPGRIAAVVPARRWAPSLVTSTMSWASATGTR